MTELGNKQIMAENLLYYMDKKSVDRNQLCEDLHFKYSTVCEWLSANKYPRIDRIEALANYFGILKSDLIEPRGSTAPIESNVAEIITTDIYNIPVFGSASAGFGAYADSEIVDYVPVYIKNPCEVAETIAIQVKGDSMYPKIEEGDVIVVHKQDSVDSGSIAVLLLDGDEGLVKKVEYTKNEVDLISINPEYKTRVFKGAELQRLRVVGLVKKVIKTL